MKILYKYYLTSIPYQPIDKIINKYINLDKLEKLTSIYTSYTQYVDEKTKSYSIPEKSVEIASFDEEKLVEKSKEEEKKEKYKNLSIDDLFKL